MECTFLSAKLPGSYKGTRKHKAPPVLVIIECPACGWKSKGAKLEFAEQEYLLHMANVHHGFLECAFCDVQTSHGLRTLPDFATLAHHVKTVHGLGDGLSLPPRSFK
jgi:hypothetical protein